MPKTLNKELPKLSPSVLAKLEARDADCDEHLYRDYFPKFAVGQQKVKVTSHQKETP